MEDKLTLKTTKQFLENVSCLYEAQKQESHRPTTTL